MKIKEITVTLGETVNLGNYESARIDVSVTTSLSEEDKPGEAYEATKKFTKSRLESAVQARVRRERK